MSHFSLITTLVIINIFKSSYSANILGIFHIPSKSHHILGNALLTGLAKQSHNVTMVSPYPSEDKITNYQHVILEGVQQFKEARMQHLYQPNSTKGIKNILTLTKMFADLSDLVLSSEQIRKLKSKQFDLVIVTPLFTESFFGLADHFKAPIILFSTFGSIPNIDKITGNVSPPSYLSTLSSQLSRNLTFRQRFTNFWTLFFYYAILIPLNEYSQNQILKKHFPAAPSLETLLEKVALVFLNSHYSWENPRPYVTNLIEIGGIHLDTPKALSKDLQQFLDNASTGVIYFSLGSNLKIRFFSKEKIRTIINVLGELKMKVIFKSDCLIDNLPSNIKRVTWLPQNDLLAHPNIKLFITHGGILSIIEAIYHRIPILGLPVFGDQHYNIENARSNNIAVQLNFDNLTETSFRDGIQEALTNLEIRKNLQLRSSLMRNQNLHPLKKAIFWVEHVLEHNGADHLKCSGRKLPYFQYFLIDVILCSLVIFVVVLVLIVYLLKKIKNLLRKLKSKID